VFVFKATINQQIAMDDGLHGKLDFHLTISSSRQRADEADFGRHRLIKT